MLPDLAPTITIPAGAPTQVTMGAIVTAPRVSDDCKLLDLDSLLGLRVHVATCEGAAPWVYVWCRHSDPCMGLACLQGLNLHTI